MAMAAITPAKSANKPQLTAWRGLMLEAMDNYGADSFIGRLSCIFQGSTDTTFYVLAVYFGSISVKNTRHAVSCGL